MCPLSDEVKDVDAIGRSLGAAEVELRLERTDIAGALTGLMSSPSRIWKEN